MKAPPQSVCEVRGIVRNVRRCNCRACRDLRRKRAAEACELAETGCYGRVRYEFGVRFEE